MRVRLVKPLVVAKGDWQVNWPSFKPFIMAVYVDMLINYGWKLGPSCHMLADTDDELHLMARSIGMKREWFQHGDGQQCPHYDLVASRRKKAVALGAIEIDRKQLLVMLNNWRIKTGKKPLFNEKDTKEENP